MQVVKRSDYYNTSGNKRALPQTIMELEYKSVEWVSD